MIDLKINRKIKLSRLTTKRKKKSSTFFALETSVSVNSMKNLVTMYKFVHDGHPATKHTKFNLTHC